MVVGIVSDAETLANKGPPVMTAAAREVMIRAVKWVDEIIPGAHWLRSSEAGFR